MKKTLTIFISCILFVNASYTQSHQKNNDTKNIKDTLLIKLDFNGRNFFIDENKLQGIKIGQFYKVLITNINQNLFSISLNSIDTVLSTKQKTPVLSDINLSLPIENQENLNQVSGISNLTNISGLEEILTSAQSDIIQFLKEVKNTQQRVEKIKFQIEKVKLSAASINGNYECIQVDSFMEAFNNEYSKSGNQYNKVLNSFKAYLAKTKAYQNSLTNDEDLKSKDTKIKDSYEALQKEITLLRATLAADKVSDYLQSLVIINNNRGDYYSLPFQFSGEQTRVQINIIPRDPSYKLPTYTTQIIFPSFPKKYNVTGISYYYGMLYDQTLTTNKPSDTTYQYSLNDSRIYETGIAALFHSGTKFKNSCTGVHFTLGIGASIAEKVRPRFMLGGGLSIGHKHMIAIDMGGILGYVSRTNKTIDFKQVYKENQKPDPLISQDLSCSIFASIGYLYRF